jgi:phosphoadenosine phosphosulfate reductase
MTHIEQLLEKYGKLTGEALLHPLILREFPEQIAVVSSFGTESAVLLRMVAAINPAVPVLFINTGKLFTETMRYCEELVGRFGLTNVQTLCPSQEVLGIQDPESSLWRTDPRACCTLRKVEPLQKALGAYTAWITGRKRYQGGSRSTLSLIEENRGRIKINPLAKMAVEQIEAEFESYCLPRHPLEQEGYLSVGCRTCSQPTGMGTSDRRSGRLELDEGGECGIHH